MGIQNFPLALQPIIQQGFLARAFEKPLISQLGYRAAARREPFEGKIGETKTITRHGMKATATTPLNVAGNTNLDNGLTPHYWTVEQFTLSINMYADTTDLNTVTQAVGIASQFVVNARVNGEQAARSLDELARNQLFNSYFGGNTWVRVTLGAAGTTLSVDDVRGFQFAYNFQNFTSAAQILASSGALSPTLPAVSGSNTLSVVIGSNTYTVTGWAADVTNVSLTPGGISGTLTTSSNVTVADGTLGNAVVSTQGAIIKRPSGRNASYNLQATDTLTMSVLLDAVASLRSDVVPTIGGAYNCHLDPTSGRELFSDPDFRQLFQGATSMNDVFRSGGISDFLGLRFLPTTEAYVQVHPTLAGVKIHRPIIVGEGVLIEGDFAGMGATEAVPADSIIEEIDGVMMVTREPLDRLQQIIAQSWYWIGGFTTPTDVVTSPTTVPTASSAVYKRARIVEHV